jgi:4-amino-4-deoxy-L-arabinose transferase-like glycosyltransferase
VSERLVRRLVILAALCIYLPFLGSVRLFDWDEINFAEAAREMLITGDWLRVHIDYAPFYEKPPLFIWAQAVCMSIFGVNEFAARLPNAIVATITLWLLVRVGQRAGQQRLGLLWAAAYAGSVLPTFYGHTGIIDPLFNLFMFLAVLVAYRSVGQGASKRDAWLAGLWMGLAVLTKGPVALGLVLLTCAIAYAWTRRTWRLPWLMAAKMTLVAVAVPALWYGLEYAANGPAFMEANLAYQWRLLTMGEAGHAQPWYYHIVVVLIGCYPASVLAFGQATPKGQSDSSDQSDFTKWMATLGLVVLAVFSVVTTKIVHYSSMTYLPLTFLAALAVDRMWRGEVRMGVAR